MAKELAYKNQRSQVLMAKKYLIFIRTEIFIRSMVFMLNMHSKKERSVCYNMMYLRLILWCQDNKAGVQSLDTLTRDKGNSI